MTTDSKGKAEILVKQFQSVFTKETSGNLPKLNKTSKRDITQINIRKEGVKNLQSKVNPAKSSGPDNIPNRVLKECANELAPIFTILFQLSLDSGELPNDWRDAKI